MRQRTCLALVAGLCLGWSSLARAGVMRLDYSGLITQVGATSGAEVGQRVTGSLTYDIDGSSPVYVPGFDEYLSSQSKPATLSVQVGDSAAKTYQTPFTVTLMQGDQSQWGDRQIPPSSIQYMANFIKDTDSSFRVTLKNQDRALFPNAMDRMPPPTSLSLSDFPIATFSFGKGLSGTFDPAGGGISGTIDRLSLTALPDPLPSVPPPGPTPPPSGGMSGDPGIGGSGGSLSGNLGGPTSGTADPGPVTDPPFGLPGAGAPPDVLTPEPGAIAPLALGLAALAWKARRRRR